MKARMKVMIHNMRYVKPQGLENEFRVDQWSPVGNPFHIDGKTSHDQVCDQYEEYFHEMLLREDLSARVFQNYLDLMVKAIKTYGTVELYCWYGPKRCHAEIIKKYLLEKTSLSQ